MTKKKTKSHKFPSPDDYRKKDALLFCPNTRVMSLYNEAYGLIGEAKAERLAKKVMKWFEREAPEKGWVACRKVPEAQTPTKSAGYILFHPTYVSIQENRILINLSLGRE